MAHDSSLQHHIASFSGSLSCDSPVLSLGLGHTSSKALRGNFIVSAWPPVRADSVTRAAGWCVASPCPVVPFSPQVLRRVAGGQSVPPHHPAFPAGHCVFVESCVCAGPATGQELRSTVLQESEHGGSWEQGTYPAVGKLTFSQKKAPRLLV